MQSQPKGKVDFESTNGEGKTAYEVAKEVEARAVLHNWLLSLEETPANLFLQKKKNAVLASAAVKRSFDLKSSVRTLSRER